MTSYQSYWGMFINDLTVLASYGEAAREDRELFYNKIREFTGLEFADFGDDVERWIQWLQADDTTDEREIRCRQKDWLARLSDEERAKLDALFTI